MIKRGEHINRNNYEEFFLLYIDGELTVIEQISVDTFLSRNPDLQQEFNLLKSTIIAPVKEVTFDKRFLFKNAESAVNTQNFEEKFLLYVDNELGESEKVEVETFVLQHPAMQESFTALKETKLEPQLIPFPNKASLYRKERKVVYMQWMRIAVAAVFIGLCYNWVGNLITNSNGNINSSVASTFTKDKSINKEVKSLATETKKVEEKVNSPLVIDNNTALAESNTNKKEPIENIVTIEAIKGKKDNLK